VDPQLVPTSPDAPFYSQRTTLDGVTYIFTFRLNQRENTYRFDLSLSDGTVLATGVKVVCGGQDLLERIKWDLRAPPGELVAIASGNDKRCPGLGELGEDRRVTLWYVNKLTVDELNAEVLAELTGG
jgi:hypothetical protein